MPIDMALYPGNVQEYNNEIQIAESDAAIGHNPGINEAEPINLASKADKAIQGKTALPAGTIYKGPQPSRFLRNKTNDEVTSAADPLEERRSGPGLSTKKKKTALVAVGLAVLWLSSR